MGIICYASMSDPPPCCHSSGQQGVGSILEDCNKEFSWGPGGFDEAHISALTSLLKENSALGHKQVKDGGWCVRWKHTVDPDRETDEKQARPAETRALQAQTQTLPSHGLKRVFLVLT